MLSVRSALLALMFALALLLPAPALAQSPPRLQSQVTDQTRAQVLAGGRSQVDAALANLLQKSDVQLWVLFVDTTGGVGVTDYATEVARANSLGGNDALLVVALGDRTDSLWRNSASLNGRLTDRELETVLSGQVEPKLRQGDFPGAVVAAANGLGPVAGSGDQSGGSGGLGLSPIVVVAALALGGYLVWRWLANRRRIQAASATEAQREAQLADEGNKLLIQSDEALRDAKEEIGFAQAQFGEAEVAPYRAALAKAQDELKAAFALRQQLDDAVPETPDERRRMLAELTEHARAAMVGLEEQKARIQQLVEVERNAPKVLAALPGQLDALEARLPEAEHTLTSFARYAEPSWASVRHNADEARAAIGHARESAAAGQKALDAGDQSTAGRAARVGQEALTEATHLVDAVDATAGALRQAEQSAQGEIAAAAADVAAARRGLGPGADAELARRLAQAEATLEQAQGAAQTERPDYPAAVQLATKANAMADEILAALKQAEERQAQQARLLESQLQSAEASYDRAAQFIAPRRRGVGSGARTRLAEAERHLDRARSLGADDVQAALAEVRRAQELADEALQLAQNDVDAYGPYGGWTGLPRGGGYPIPIPIPFPTGGGWGGGFPGSGGGFPGGGGGGGMSGGGGGGAVGGRW